MFVSILRRKAESAGDVVE